MATMVYCSVCGKQIHETAASCPACGAVQQVRPAAVAAVAPPPPAFTDKRILPAFLLCLFFGFLGAHRFYVGKIGTAIAQIFTVGGLGVWWLIDFIMIIVGAFKDKNGVKITQWT